VHCSSTDILGREECNSADILGRAAVQFYRYFGKIGSAVL
jgi:hypothetical protein